MRKNHFAEASIIRNDVISQRQAYHLVGVNPKAVRRDRLPDNPEIRRSAPAI